MPSNLASKNIFFQLTKMPIDGVYLHYVKNSIQLKSEETLMLFQSGHFEQSSTMHSTNCKYILNTCLTLPYSRMVERVTFFLIYKSFFRYLQSIWLNNIFKQLYRAMVSFKNEYYITIIDKIIYQLLCQYRLQSIYFFYISIKYMFVV